MRQTHDIGGLPIGDAVDPAENDLSLFASRVTALVHLCRDRKRGIFVTDELRRTIESLSEEQYFGLSYYEKWIQALRLLLIEKAVFSEEDIAAKLAQIKARGQKTA